MKRTLLMEAVLGQTRLAVLEDGVLCAVSCERPDDENLTGNIYLGRVSDVLPGMNAAFVDIGIGKNAFLPASGRARIEALVRLGQELMVQVDKAATGDKGPRVTTEIILAGRTLALLPGTKQVGVSKKIPEEAERERLRSALVPATKAMGLGAIARTAAAGESAEALSAELHALGEQWAEIARRGAHATAPRRLYVGAGLALQAVRDLLNDDTNALITDNPGLYGQLRQQAQVLAPAWVDRIQLHKGSLPLFDLYGIDDKLDKALRKKVWLPSGGFLFVEETEALTVIDVNTGKYTGKRDLEETVFRLNSEAAAEVMRQLRLRDIGGIVVVDFIDMESPEHREALLTRLRELAAADRNRAAVAGITNLGLVEITRRRARPSLRRQLLHDCETCGGTGVVWSHETLARRIGREVWRRRWTGTEGALLVTARRPVADWLATIGAPAGGDVYVQVDDGLSEGAYTISPADPAKLPGDVRLLKRG